MLIPRVFVQGRNVTGASEDTELSSNRFLRCAEKRTESVKPRSDRTLLGAKGIATRSKKLLGASGRTTRSKDATSSKKLLGEGHCY